MFQTQFSSMKIGMMLFPNLTQLDFTAPYEVFSHLPNTQIYRLAPTLEPVYSDSEFPLIPNTSFGKVPRLDMLFVSGGLGVNAKLEDAQFLQFLRKQGEDVRCATLIGAGSLLLAAAGLLQGYRATADWCSLELLELFGIDPVSAPLVVGRNRITGSSATNGIAFGLAVVNELFGTVIAQEIQLRLDCNSVVCANGASKSVPSDVLTRVQDEQQSLLKARLQIIQRNRFIRPFAKAHTPCRFANRLKSGALQILVS